MATVAKRAKLLLKDSKPCKFNVRQWAEICYERDFLNSVMSRDEFKELLETNVDFLTDNLPLIAVGFRGHTTVAELSNLVKRALQYFVKYYLCSNLPYREKCRMLHRLDAATDNIAERPTVPNICCQMISFN